MASRQLLLLRHAKSSWADPALDDHSRPLNSRGRDAATKMGEWIKKSNLVPDVALVSDANRTIETWDRLDLPGSPNVQFMEELYGASPHDQLALLRELPETRLRAMLIGHNPSIGALARGLAEDAIEGPMRPRFLKYPTAGLAVYEIEAETWAELAPECAQLVKFVDPRSL